jgi:hypothetical protein
MQRIRELDYLFEAVAQDKRIAMPHLCIYMALLEAPVWLTSLRQFLLTERGQKNLTSPYREKMIALNEHINRYCLFGNSKALQIFASLKGGQFATA